MLDLTKKLSHVYWIGGSPCAGKTTIFRILTEKYGFSYYKSDDQYDKHVCKSNEAQHPFVAKLKGLSWGQCWAPRFCPMPVRRQGNNDVPSEVVINLPSNREYK